MIVIRYFASIREAIGTDVEHLPFTAAASTVGAVLDLCRMQSERHTAALASNKPIRAALNQTLVSLEVAVQDGDEIAFFPPVTGG